MVGFLQWHIIYKGTEIYQSCQKDLAIAVTFLAGNILINSSI